MKMYFENDNCADQQETLLHILTKCSSRVDVAQLGVVIDRMLEMTHRFKSTRIGEILKFCINAIARNIHLHQEAENREGYGSGSSSSTCDGNKLRIASSEALRLFILQALHGSAPPDTRNLCLELIFLLFKTSNCKWSLEGIEETKKMKDSVRGQFAGLFCSILRGEIHLLLGELVYLSGYENEQEIDERRHAKNGKEILTVEQRNVRMDRIGSNF